MASVIVKIPKNTTEKQTPLTVAIGFVNKFARAATSMVRKISVKPIGTCTPRQWMLNGTANSRGCRILNRSTTIDMRVEDETPNHAEGVRFAQQNHIARG